MWDASLAAPVSEEELSSLQQTLSSSPDDAISVADSNISTNDAHNKLQSVVSNETSNNSASVLNQNRNIDIKKVKTNKSLFQKAKKMLKQKENPYADFMPRPENQKPNATDVGNGTQNSEPVVLEQEYSKKNPILKKNDLYSKQFDARHFILDSFSKLTFSEILKEKHAWDEKLKQKQENSKSIVEEKFTNFIHLNSAVDSISQFNFDNDEKIINRLIKDISEVESSAEKMYATIFNTEKEILNLQRIEELVSTRVMFSDLPKKLLKLIESASFFDAAILLSIHGTDLKVLNFATYEGYVSTFLLESLKEVEMLAQKHIIRHFSVTPITFNDGLSREAKERIIALQMIYIGLKDHLSPSSPLRRFPMFNLAKGKPKAKVIKALNNAEGKLNSVEFIVEHFLIDLLHEHLPGNANSFDAFLSRIDTWIELISSLGQLKFPVLAKDENLSFAEQENLLVFQKNLNNEFQSSEYISRSSLALSKLSELMVQKMLIFVKRNDPDVNWNASLSKLNKISQLPASDNNAALAKLFQICLDNKLKDNKHPVEETDINPEDIWHQIESFGYSPALSNSETNVFCQFLKSSTSFLKTTFIGSNVIANDAIATYILHLLNSIALKIYSSMADAFQNIKKTQNLLLTLKLVGAIEYLLSFQFYSDYLTYALLELNISSQLKLDFEKDPEVTDVIKKFSRLQTALVAFFKNTRSYNKLEPGEDNFQRTINELERESLRIELVKQGLLSPEMISSLLT